MKEMADGVVRRWEHAGLTCLLRHGFLGIPCGYVAVPEGHPLHGVDYLEYESEPDVHGGVTFAGRIGSEWCVGFDMGHSFDFDGCMPIRTDDECAAETERLAEQLAAMA